MNESFEITELKDLRDIYTKIEKLIESDIWTGIKISGEINIYD